LKPIGRGGDSQLFKLSFPKSSCLEHQAHLKFVDLGEAAMSHAENPPELPYPELPFWRTVGLSYSSYFHHFIDALRASWLWLAVVGAFPVLASWQHWSSISEVMANLAAGEPPQMPTSIVLVVLYGVEYILLSFAGVSIAVAWHRLMILNEQPGFSGRNLATKNLWRYVAMATALFLILFLPSAIIMPPTFYFQQPASGPPSQEFSVLRLLFFAAACVLAIPATLRLTLLLPAQAIGDTGLTLKQTWNRTRGNAWRLFWGSMVTGVPPVLISQIVFLFSTRPPLPSEAFDENVIATMTDLLFLPIWIGFLSHAYRHFFQAPLQLPE
jgi:hypothetical protein